MYATSTCPCRRGAHPFTRASNDSANAMYSRAKMRTVGCTPTTSIRADPPPYKPPAFAALLYVQPDMDGLLDKVKKKAAASAGIKHDEGESTEQTLKEAAVERVLKQNVERVAGAKVASSAHTAKAIEKVADKVAMHVPARAIAAAAASGGGGSGGGATESQGKSTKEKLLGKA
eukprot:IDg18002t1